MISRFVAWVRAIEPDVWLHAMATFGIVILARWFHYGLFGACGFALAAIVAREGWKAATRPPDPADRNRDIEGGLFGIVVACLVTGWGA